MLEQLSLTAEEKLNDTQVYEEYDPSTYKDSGNTNKMGADIPNILTPQDLGGPHVNLIESRLSNDSSI